MSILRWLVQWLCDRYMITVIIAYEETFWITCFFTAERDDCVLKCRAIAEFERDRDIKYDYSNNKLLIIRGIVLKD